MSHATVNQCSIDPALLSRVIAALAKEAFNNVDLSDTKTALLIRQNGPLSVSSRFMWAIAIDNEVAYQYAVETNNPDPGGDGGVITDGNITSGITAHWPQEETEFNVGSKYIIEIIGTLPT